MASHYVIIVSDLNDLGTKSQKTRYFLIICCCILEGRQEGKCY